MKKLILILAVIFTFTACKDSEKAQYNALGKPHIIKLYAANGTIIQEWESTGSVSNEANSDGWYFEDRVTGKLVEITGSIVITIK